MLSRVGVTANRTLDLMGYCPNCSNPLDLHAPESSRCGALFGESGWKVLSQAPVSSRLARSLPDRRTGLEKLLDVLILIGVVGAPLSCSVIGLTQPRALLAIPMLVVVGVLAAAARLLLWIANSLHGRPKGDDV